ncbi:MAG: DUF421 domain-containing protein [Candidatus Eremiobacteraeota bacterium]|nr:DUF421 domain-containing protein [Candidatus Eremiobacteraeota bacterium]
MQTFYRILMATAAVYFGVVAISRINGLRTFSKMSSFDLASTVAVGSIMAATIINDKIPLSEGMLAILLLIGAQRLLASLREQGWISWTVDNRPLLLMWNGQFRHDAMRKARITEGDLCAKLREANALRLDQVRAVVLETTGDVSVLHGECEPADTILQDVEGAGS